jgi:hypothetical protein
MKKLVVAAAFAMLSTASFAWMDEVPDDAYVIHVEWVQDNGPRHGALDQIVFTDKAACEAFLKADGGDNHAWAYAKISLRAFFTMQHIEEVAPFDCVTAKEARALATLSAS